MQLKIDYMILKFSYIGSVISKKVNKIELYYKDISIKIIIHLIVNLINMECAKIKLS